MSIADTRSIAGQRLLRPVQKVPVLQCADNTSGSNLAALRLRDGIRPDDIAPMIQRAAQFSMNRILQRYRSDHDVDEETARLHEQELKRFLVCGAVFDNPIGMRGEVDDLWHTFVLFTRDYRHFCQDVCGFFIDHIPLEPGQDVRSGDGSGYAYFHAAYRALFGHPPPETCWPVPGGCENAIASAEEKPRERGIGTAASAYFSDDSCSVCVAASETS